MKWRNQLLALFCLFVFFAVGVFYFRYWVVQKPFGIILFVAEGLDLRTLAAARVYAGSADKPLVIDSLSFTSVLKNYSQNSTVADAAAAATALATGAKVNNGAVALDPDGNELATLLYLAHTHRRMTGLVTNGSLTAPTAASFYGHGLTSENGCDFAAQLAGKANLDVVLGGGAADFYPAADGGRRTDGRTLLTELATSGYEVVRTLQDLEEIPRWRRAKLFGLFSHSDLLFADEAEAGDDQPTLSDLVRRAIELLQFNRGGYLLVVDAALVAKATDQNQTERALGEAVELDRAISVALDYAGTKTAVFVCGDMANGARSEAGPALPVPARNNDVSAPANPRAKGELSEVETPGPAPSDPPQQEPTPQESASAPIAPMTDDVAFGTGPGAAVLHGVLENTAIFEIIRDNL
ncbi:MAG: alkaline phosphatase [Chthoniobacterales bacterium]